MMDLAEAFKELDKLHENTNTRYLTEAASRLESAMLAELKYCKITSFDSCKDKSLDDLWQDFTNKSDLFDKNDTRARAVFDKILTDTKANLPAYKTITSYRDKDYDDAVGKWHSDYSWGEREMDSTEAGDWQISNKPSGQQGLVYIRLAGEHAKEIKDKYSVKQAKAEWKSFGFDRSGPADKAEQVVYNALKKKIGEGE